MTAMNRWPIDYVFQYVRMHLTEPVKDWFSGREFPDSSTFEKNIPTHVRARLIARTKYEQRPNESLITYIQSKLCMCRGIGHVFDVAKDYVLRGLRGRETALYAVGRCYTSKEELLADLLEWERMNAFHASAGIL